MALTLASYRDERKLFYTELPCHTPEESIQTLREVGMLEWIYHVRTTYPPWMVQRT